MKNKIINTLLNIGIPADVKGFSYIVDYILLLEDKEWKNCKVTTLYYKIAKDNQVKDKTVERCIRYAFSWFLKNGNQNIIQQYFPGAKKTNGNMLKILHYMIFLDDNAEKNKGE